MKVSLRQIDGPWTAGYVLDRHLLHSVYVGDDSDGHARFDHTRTEVGEALHQLKHRGDKGQAEPLARALRTHLVPRFGPIGFIVPMPAARVRPWQPVAAVARALAMSLRVPAFERLLLRTPLTAPLSDRPTREERLAALSASFSLHDEIRNQGLWNVLLIDDTCDSGATLEAASLLLRKYRKVDQLYVAALTWK
ncbi:ComF family protein [Mitsuaria sp. GD03876]|uniref:ComF family protein n=1 Tax=Mitsuaria sp. GD03876 TaxID=2975399 RepID=UPI00244B590D|nr:ComF family protein [Mitsuaria sp. GD03876]MDH0864949.1 ComF family protein [Mitsuaria sp. GD03876]